MKNLIAVLILFTFGVVADVEVVDDYVISAKTIQSESELLSHCQSYNLKGVTGLTTREFVHLKTHPEFRSFKPLINTFEGKTLATSNNRYRRVTDVAYKLQSNPHYGICKGASKYSLTDFRNGVGAEPVAATYELAGINLNGTIRSEFGIKPQPKANSNTNFKSFISAKLIRKHHPEALRDKELYRYLIKHYNSSYKLPEFTGVANGELVKIYAKRSDKSLRFSSALEKAIYNRFNDKLEQVHIRYDVITGRILMLATQQYVDMLDRNLPKIADQLAAKWGVKYYKEHGIYNYFLNEHLTCQAKHTSSGILGIISQRRFENLMTIECEFKQPHDMLYLEESQVRKLVDDNVNNPPNPPVIDVVL